MTERITKQQLTDKVRRLRRVQVICAVSGMGGFMFALLGGAIESRELAWIGIGVFVLGLAGIFGSGALSWLAPRSSR